jgi:hypothetical protein
MKSTPLTVLQLFANKKRYIIPMFQRQYVWSIEKQWTPFWEDVERKVVERLIWQQRLNESVGDEHRKVQDDGPSEHFLGAIVLDQHHTFGIEVPANLVIDGQQRLTTCQIFLAAFRDSALAHGVPQFGEELRTYTANTGLMKAPDVEKYKVWPTQWDEPHFCRIIDAGGVGALADAYPPLQKQQLTGVPRIVQAYVYFSKSLESFLNKSVVSEYLHVQPSVDERVAAIFATFNEHLQVVDIELEGQDDPQVIFETLNARGEPLLPSDLLRNYFFWRVNRENAKAEEVYHAYWEHFDTGFWKKEERQGRLTRPRVDLFFYNFLQMKTGDEVNVGRLYHAYKDWSERPSRKYETTTSELQDIHRYSLELQKLMLPDSGNPIGHFARVLQVFDVKTVFPLMLKVLAEGGLDDAELEGLLGDVESYLVRRQVCGLSSQAFARMFVNWVGQINSGAEISRSRLRDIMLAEKHEWGTFPSDAAFLESWLRDPMYARLKSNGRLEYILRRLEIEERRAKHEDIEIKTGLTVEHVMPQDWYAHWRLRDGSSGKTLEERLVDPSEESQARDRVVQTMGNLTLLTGSLNTALLNHPFSEKVKQIKGYSLLAMNKYFIKLVDAGVAWDEDAILARGQVLFETAKKLWPYPG